jgi:hypothetical protein
MRLEMYHRQPNAFAAMKANAKAILRAMGILKSRRTEVVSTKEAA